MAGSGMNDTRLSGSSNDDDRPSGNHRSHGGRTPCHWDKFVRFEDKPLRLHRQPARVRHFSGVPCDSRDRRSGSPTTASPRRPGQGGARSRFRGRFRTRRHVEGGRGVPPPRAAGLYPTSKTATESAGEPAVKPGASAGGRPNGRSDDVKVACRNGGESDKDRACKSNGRMCFHQSREGLSCWISIAEV